MVTSDWCQAVLTSVPSNAVYDFIGWPVVILLFWLGARPWRQGRAATALEFGGSSPTAGRHDRAPVSTWTRVADRLHDRSRECRNLAALGKQPATEYTDVLNARPRCPRSRSRSRSPSASRRRISMIRRPRPSQTPQRPIAR